MHAVRRAQRTIRVPVEFEGVGLHTGERAKVVLKPAESDFGVEFVRVDLPESPRISVNADNAAYMARRTAVEKDGAEVQTIEHLMATLHGLGIDNVSIEIDGREVPGLDGSSKPIVDLIRAAGIVEQKAVRKTFTVDEPISVIENGSSLVALPAAEGEGLTIEYTLDYPNSGVGSQYRRLSVDEHTFERELAPARTFCLESEVEALRGIGLGKGANHSNTLVFGMNGVVENELRFADEPVRHKILDLVGDLFLARAELRAHIVATKTGHNLNVKLAQKISSAMRSKENRGVLQRDTGLEIREIMRILPHRYPFLLIDRVIEIEGYRRAVGVKNVSINEPFFQGHWPDQPVMPGVLQIEAMAQLAGVLLLRKLENTGKLAVLLSIDHVKLRKAVIPGDQLRLEAETVRVKARTAKIHARALVNDKLVAEAVMKFMLADA